MNDAPAAGRTDIDVAIGNGTGLAIETTGITLTSGDLHAFLTALHLSTVTMPHVRQNLVLAFGYHAATIPVATGSSKSWPGSHSGR